MGKLTLEQIQQQIRNTSDNSLLAFNELHDLVDILKDGEIIERAISAQFAELDGSGYGMLVATDRRLLFVHIPTNEGRILEEFPYEKINSVSYDDGLILNEIYIITNDHRYELKYVEKEEGPSIVDLINKKL